MEPDEKGPHLPGRDLDRLVAAKMGLYPMEIKNVLGEYYPGKDSRWRKVPHYSTDIGAAWEVFNWIMDNKIFSKRREFLHLLQEQAILDDGSLPAWPDILVVLRKRMPHAICLAFLALTDSPNPARSPRKPGTDVRW